MSNLRVGRPKTGAAGEQTISPSTSRWDARVDRLLIAHASRRAELFTDQYQLTVNGCILDQIDNPRLIFHATNVAHNREIYGDAIAHPQAEAVLLPARVMKSINRFAPGARWENRKLMIGLLYWRIKASPQLRVVLYDRKMAGISRRAINAQLVSFTR